MNTESDVAALLASELDAKMKAYRNGAGISQPQLAKESGISQATISRTLQGSTAPTIKTVTGLASVLGPFKTQISLPAPAHESPHIPVEVRKIIDQIIAQQENARLIRVISDIIDMSSEHQAADDGYKTKTLPDLKREKDHIKKSGIGAKINVK